MLRTMENHLRIWVLLLLITGVSTQNSSVSVSCGSSHLVIIVPVNLFGTGVMVNANELILGSGCTVTAVRPNVLLLEYPLFACGATRQLLPGSIHYKNILHYVPSAPDGVIRANPFSHAINCFYPRSWNVSSLGLRPTWVPFTSTVMEHQSLVFALEVYDSSWSQLMPNPTYYLGDFINIQASVRKDNHVPLRIYVDECVARPSAESSVKYEVITNHGCFVDGLQSGSHFLATREDWFLRFQLDTFTFIGASNDQIYLICHLKAVPVGSANHLNKACSYDQTTATWNSNEGVDCSCCAESHTGCGSKRRKRRQQQRRGTFGEGELKLGPIELKGEQTHTSLQTHSRRTLELVSIVTNSAPTVSNTSPAAGPSLNQMANIIVRKEGMKEDVSRFHFPFSTATMVISVACSFIVLVSILACFYSNKQARRIYQMGMIQPVLGETSAVAMAPASAGTSGAGASGQSSIASKKPDDLVAVF
ncbi:zona pellucida sperm-binding protein 3-like [Thamnophis elegans]|uniref:zona pellucida sperm-binding protein 3-like n=1 Tax=Thamnophis elegans TaxID=35005 RepID=UPI001378F76C|nr:zona pellucida sperm-binding protein 3-like [Thamnophis elegans]